MTFILPRTSLLLLSTILSSSSACQTVSEVNAIAQQLYDTFIYGQPHQVQKDYIGGAIRLGFHDAGTFDPAKNTVERLTGPTGCIPLDDEANFGLDSFLASIDGIFQEHAARCPQADFWYLVGAVAIDAAIDNADDPMGPYHRHFTPFHAGGHRALDTFTYGRETQLRCPEKFDQLPKHQLGLDHIRDVFTTRMGFDDREITALMGAHSIGTCHRNNSGFNLPWDATDTALDTEYYRNIVDTSHQWARAQVQFDSFRNGPQKRNVWLNLNDSTTTTPLNLLNTDMALMWDFGTNDWTSTSESTKGYCQIGLEPARAQASRKNWAGWKAKDTKKVTGIAISDLVCPEEVEVKKCPRATENTADVVSEYIADDNGQKQFQMDFIAAWNKMASLGYNQGSLRQPQTMATTKSKKTKTKKTKTKKTKSKTTKTKKTKSKKIRRVLMGNP